MTLTYILLVTFAGGLASVTIAAMLTVGLLSRIVKHLVSLSTGVLLSTALLHVLPEAFESGADPHNLFLALLGGLMFFFLLEKAELFDLYEGKQAGEGKKSVAFSLMFRAADRTLTDEDATTAFDAVVQELHRSFAAEIRK